ncbi:thiamine pyrophosphate-dependent enzyme [Furfurilactobacillus entadae]|uniref:thiamine pyrophosphate-dependent enzyme n=1 Tax=Furfurilactobacillus entadae TaxID=2922307 RepID=UPI0035EB4AD7
MKAYDVLANVLENWGVDHVYGLPGNSVDSAVEGLYKAKQKIKFIQIRHEETAGLAMSAEAKMSNKLAVSVVTGGPGGIHLVNGVYDSKLDHVPTLSIIGQVDQQDVNLQSFQEIQMDKLFEDAAIYNKLVINAQSLPELLNEAIETAYARRGPAVLTVPDDLWNADIKYVPSLKNTTSNIVNEPVVDLKQIKHASEIINSSDKVLVMSGRGAKKAGHVLQKFIEKIKAPIIQATPSKGIIDDDHPYSLANIGIFGSSAAFSAMQDADVLIMIGTNFPFSAYLELNKNIKTIQIDLNPSNLGKRRPIDIGIHGDTKLVLEHLMELVDEKESDVFVHKHAEEMKKWRKWLLDLANKEPKKVSPEYLFTKLDQVAPKNVVYSVDIGTSSSWGPHYLNVQQTQDYVTSPWLATMGVSLPSAIAAGILDRERPVYAIAGDGGFAMSMQDFVTAVRYDLPILMVVLNNDELALIEYEQFRAKQNNYATDLSYMDFAKFAESVGAVGVNINSKEALNQALDKYKNPKHPVLLDVRTTDDTPLGGTIVNGEGKEKWTYAVDTRDGQAKY